KQSEDCLGHESPPSQGISASSSEQQHLFSTGPSSTTVTVTATITKIADDENNWVSSPKDTVFPETIPEESSSTEEEHVVIFRLPSLHESDGFLRDPSIYTAETSLFQLAMRKNSTGKNNNVKTEQISSSSSDSKAKPSIQKIGSSTDKDSVDSSKHPSTDGAAADMEGSRKTLTAGQPVDITSATFLDVAVLRCLFITQWQEEGIYWALHYLYNRLRDISEETAGQQQPRRRSNSLPIPKIEVSLYQSTELKKQDNNKDFIEVPEVKDVSLLADFLESPYTNKKPLDEPVHIRRASEKTKKRMKMADLKAFVETKLLSKSDKALEKIGQDDSKPLGDHADYHRSLDTGDEHLSRPSSAMSKMFEPASNLVKGKSMPSLRYIGEIHWDRRRPSRFDRPTQPMANPIITVTEHTPTPSPDYLKRQGSMDSQLDIASLSGSKLGNWQERKASLTRSQTDSNITYAGEDIPEVPGSACYITKEGDIDFQVVLKAVHATSLRDNTACTLRVLEVILNLIELLMDVGVLKQCLRNEAMTGSTSTSGQTTSPGKGQKMPASTTSASLGGELEKSAKPMTSHRLVMNVIIRFVNSAKEIKTPDNLGLYCEVRQLMTYVKEGHGSVFRRVALSALIDTADRPSKKETNVQTTRVIRYCSTCHTSFSKRNFHRHMHHSEIEDQGDIATDTSYTIDERGVRKLLFKKRSTSSTCASLLETEAEELSKISQSPLGNLRKRHILTPRQSEKALGITEPPSKSKTKSKLGGIVNWFKKSDQTSVEENENQDNGDSITDTSSFIRQSSKFYPNKTGKSNVGQTLQKAKRRVEDRFNKFVLKKGKKKDGSTEESSGGSTAPVYSGALRLSFLLETCPPGSVPDAHLLASILDLPHSTVVARATLLLECSYFVHCCNKGQWPSWMKLNFPMFRPSGPLPPRGPSTGIRRSHIMQRAAGKMFYQWAEVLGQRLEEIMNEDKQLETQIGAMVLDEQKQKELLMQDEEEDFLDEASIYTYGSSCPMALRLIACILLHEITSFLRETYQTLPKSSRMTGKERPPPWERLYSREANRRWSMALSSMGHSQTSAQSLQSIAGDRDSGQAERKISFVLHEPDNESEGSSNTTVTMQAMMQGEETKRIGQPPRPYLLRRGTAAPAGGSFKRRSLKLRRGTKEGKDMEVEYRSDTSEPGMAGEASGEESPGVLSDDQPPESPSDSNDTDETTKNMPWLKVMVQVSNSFYYYCTHQNFCHPFCYRRVMRGCSRLVKAVRKVYGEEFGVLDDKLSMDFGGKKKTNKKDKGQNRKVSDQTSSQVSPIRRKDSVGKKDKIEKTLDGSQLSKLASKDSSRDIADSDTGHDPSKSNDDGKPSEPPPILKYIKTQVKDAFHSPLAVLLKGAVILAEEHFIEIIPVAWELLLESNQEVTACAASLFILAAVKAPQPVSDIMQHGLSHPDAAIRINAILRFQVLWKMRYQVWPRMEESAHILFKVPPPGIEFTLPSPKIGIESLDVVDSPWELLVKTKVEEVTINQERHLHMNRAYTILVKNTMKWQMMSKSKVRLGTQDIIYIRLTLFFHLVYVQLWYKLLPCWMMLLFQLMVIWCCLVEDSALFLRYILERLTREKQEQMFKILRHVIRFIPKLPQQAAFALYNYIIGYVMFYVRSPHEDGQMLIGAALSLLWMVVHSVHGIMFKDLKQILRKEQCDASILLTANVPSAKKIIVHGPQDPDAAGIPSQFPVQEDTQFCQILREALDFFGIDDCRHKEFFLVDYKTHQIRNPSAYVRDYYFFKRSQYPQLELVHMKPEEAFNALQKQELLHKFVEIGKVLLTWAILKNVDMVVQRVVFLHEELMKLPSFPRKALESDLDLYKGGPLGKELLGLDVLHKFMWVRLIARMFEAMAGNFAYSGDIHLFLNVLNGAVILHSEDACILRYVMATYINAAFHFKNIFSTNGYLLIMPTLLKIYSNHQTNKLVTTTVEYAVKQFYLMNRKPFILQMFGSVSAMLDTDEEGTFGDAHKIQSSCLFNLLLSLETPSPDPLNIAELVKEEKPLKAIDFCYHDENEMVTILDCISLCVMVVSYSSESMRGYQMLIILEAILPCYVQHIQLPSYNKEGKTEKEIINQLAVSIKTLVNNCESLTKSYNGPYRSSPEHKGSSQRNYSRGPYSPGFDFEDESHSKFMSEHSRAKSMYEHDVEDSEVLRAEYRRPRDVLLSLVGEFMCRATARLQELNKKNNQEGKTIELLDLRSHIRLADIAHSLLKVSPYDPESMGCRGLQHYMSYILPSTEWANDAMRPALVTILRRLDKVFQKISKKPSIRRNTDWDAAAGLLKGIYDTMSLIVSDCYANEGVSSATAALMSQAPPPHFSSMVVRLIALQIQNTNDNCTLEQVCGGSSTFSTQDKTESMIMNLIMPLCLRVGSGRKGDVSAMKQNDISFALTLVLHAMSPPNTKSIASSGPNLKAAAEIRTGSLTFTGTRDTKTRTDDSLDSHCKNYEGARKEKRSCKLFVGLFRLCGDASNTILAQPPISDFERNIHTKIRDKMRGIGLPFPKSRGALLMELAHQMKELKEELEDVCD
ncbi:unc-80 -like protein, partial [Asbolus verrucosus]